MQNNASGEEFKETQLNYQRWTQEEKERLWSAVEQSKQNSKINWQSVSQKMVTKDAMQCKSYYRVLLRQQEELVIQNLFQEIETAASKTQLRRKDRIRIYIYAQFYGCDFTLVHNNWLPHIPEEDLPKLYQMVVPEYHAQMSICGYLSQNQSMNVFTKQQLKYLFDYVSALKYYLENHEAQIFGGAAPDKPRFSSEYEDMFTEPLDYVELQHVKDIDMRFGLKLMQKNIWKALKKFYV